eukprot:scaffold174844_cov15-Prasinocladus_malaysianus.AAC.1
MWQGFDFTADAIPPPLRSQKPYQMLMVSCVQIYRGRLPHLTPTQVGRRQKVIQCIKVVLAILSHDCNTMSYKFA